MEIDNSEGGPTGTMKYGVIAAALVGLAGVATAITQK